MSDPFQIEGNFTFARTQPREWRDQPFASDAGIGKGVLRAIGTVLLVVAVFGLALWSISQQTEAARVMVVAR